MTVLLLLWLFSFAHANCAHFKKMLIISNFITTLCYGIITIGYNI
jgi:hypothetical protein